MTLSDAEFAELAEVALEESLDETEDVPHAPPAEAELVAEATPAPDGGYAAALVVTYIGGDRYQVTFANANVFKQGVIRKERAVYAAGAAAYRVQQLLIQEGINPKEVTLHLYADRQTATIVNRPAKSYQRRDAVLVKRLREVTSKFAAVRVIAGNKGFNQFVADTFAAMASDSTLN